MNDSNLRVRDVVVVLFFPIAIRDWWRRRKHPPRLGVQSLEDMRRDTERQRRLEDWPEG